MTVKELVDNYSQAYQQFEKAKEDIDKHKDILKQDFKEKHPEYYIGEIFTLNQIVTASVYEVATNKIVTSFAYLSFDGNWKW